MTIQITLNPTEELFAKYLAKCRYESNRASGVSDGQRGPQSSMETDLVGVGAELAFCRLFNVYPDFTIGPRKGGIDCTVRGITVDVKATLYSNGRLIAVPSKVATGLADLYALMIGCDWPVFKFAGFATAATLFAREKLTDLGHGPTQAVGQGELFDSLLDWVGLENDGVARHSS